MKTRCYICRYPIKPTKRLSPTCSAECRAARKKLRYKQWRLSNMDHCRQYARKRARLLSATLTDSERDIRRRKAREYRNGMGRAGILAAKNSYRQSKRGRAAIKHYLTSNRLWINEEQNKRSKKKRNQIKRARMASDPDYKHAVLMRRLKKSHTHILHNKRLAGRRNYWAHRERRLARAKLYDRSIPRRQQVLSRRRLGNAAFNFLADHELMTRPHTKDQNTLRRLHTKALAVVSQVGLLNILENTR